MKRPPRRCLVKEAARHAVRRAAPRAARLAMRWGAVPAITTRAITTRAVATWAVATLAVATLAVASSGTRLTAELLGEHQVRYHSRDQVSSWVGVAPLAELTADFDASDLSTARVRAVVRPAEFDSGVGLRDFQARRSVFETDEHPEAVFELLELRGSPLDLPDGAERRLVAVGTLELRGERRPIEIDGMVRRSGDEVEVRASFAVSLEDYGMRRPRFLMLVAEDEVRVDVELRARLRSDSTATIR